MKHKWIKILGRRIYTGYIVSYVKKGPDELKEPDYPWILDFLFTKDVGKKKLRIRFHKEEKINEIIEDLDTFYKPDVITHQPPFNY